MQRMSWHCLSSWTVRHSWQFERSFMTQNPYCTAKTKFRITLIHSSYQSLQRTNIIAIIKICLNLILILKYIDKWGKRNSSQIRVSCAPTTDRSRRQFLKFARQRKFKDNPTWKLRHLLTTVQGKVKKVQGNDAQL